MSEQPAEYDPTTFHADIHEIYSSPEVLEQIRVVQAISQELTRPKRPITTVQAPEFFGERSKETTQEQLKEEA